MQPWIYANFISCKETFNNYSLNLEMGEILYHILIHQVGEYVIDNHEEKSTK